MAVPKRVAIQGQEGSYHALATHTIFGKDIGLVPCEWFPETFDALSTNKADYAIVAIENSLAGSITEVYDLLRKSKLNIVAELYMQIELKLIGFEGVNLKDIHRVYSHPVALSEAQSYLHEKLPQAELFERNDTAESVEFVSQAGDKSQAAIGSEAAAHLHGMSVLADHIEANNQNYTRFIVLNKSNKPVDGANKTSIVLTLKDKPGALYNLLGVFAKRNINLSKLESRPHIGRIWHYYFYIDFEAGIDQPGIGQLLGEVYDMTDELIVLGSYPKGRVVED
jgi:prephenate dehydratase